MRIVIRYGDADPKWGQHCVVLYAVPQEGGSWAIDDEHGTLITCGLRDEAHAREVAAKWIARQAPGEQGRDVLRVIGR